MDLALSRLVDALPGLVWTALPDGRVDFLNQRWRDYTGLGLDEAGGFGWQDTIHPDDLPGVLQRWRAALESGRPVEVEARFRRADGDYRRFLLCTAPITDDTGRLIKWCGLNTDIEDRLKGEEAWRTVERSRTDANMLASEAELRQSHIHLTEAQRLSNTGSFVADLVADVHTWSDQFYRICEFEPGSTVTITRLREIIHPEDISSFEGAMQRALSGEAPDFLFRIITARGGVKHLRGIAHRSGTVEGRPIFVGAVQDVTASTLAEHALNAARADLAHAARVLTLSTLAASIAHEVNQPLSGIVTNANTSLRMLAGDPPNLDGARAAAQRTLRDASRASEVVQRLRAMFVRRELTAEAVDLGQAAREVLTLSWSDLQRNGVILQTDLGGDLPAVMGDRIQLQQVILNLIVNASDAMRSVGDRPRQLFVGTALDGDGCVRLTVRDSGIGFGPEALARLFEAFYTTKDNGMGIGLSVSRTIIESHEGRLWAIPNDNGPGATFCFSIPCAATLAENHGTHDANGQEDAARRR